MYLEMSHIKKITIPRVVSCLKWMHANGGLGFVVVPLLKFCFLSFNDATVLCSCHRMCISGNCEYKPASGINNEG